MTPLRDLFHYVARIHQSADWPALLGFYGLVLAAILLICLLILLLRGRALASAALQHAGRLGEDLHGMRAEIDELERRMEKRLDSRASDLDARMTKKMDQKGDLIQERVEQRASSLSDTMHRLESRAARASEDVERFRARVDEVERRIPNLFDRLDEFRETLGRTFQVELNSVLNSFDSSLVSILQQMKSDLQLGLSRVEGLEAMVRSRERAEKSLLGAAEGAAPPLPGSLEEEEKEFAEWEQQAKELAEQPGARPKGEAPVEKEPLEGLLDAIVVDEEPGDEDSADEDKTAYPAEMPEPTDEDEAGQQ
jgi:DNA repair exonuclease SbcCD ATPase subunit